MRATLRPGAPFFRLGGPLFAGHGLGTTGISGMSKANVLNVVNRVAASHYKLKYFHSVTLCCKLKD
jgi:hypothetical protein